MNPIYEYIAAIFVMTLIVGYSIYSLNTMSSSQLNIAQEEQLQPAAERLMDKILLTTGYPIDWGTNVSIIDETNLLDFGLASKFGEAYRVSVDDILRLVYKVETTLNPLYVNSTVMGKLTGIYENNNWKYGFRLLLTSALKINITEGPYDPQKREIPTNFTIDVSNYFGKYASNAEINALYFCVYNIDEDTFDYFANETSTLTNWQGRAFLDFGKINQTFMNSVDDYVLIVTANYYGLQSQQILMGNKVPTLTLLIVGQYLIANFTDPDIKYPMGAHQLHPTAIEFTSGHQVILNPCTNVTDNGQSGKIINQGGKNYTVWQLADMPTEDVIFSGLVVKKTGRLHLVLASRPTVPSVIDYRSHSFAYAGISSDTIYRLVRIGQNSYFAELTLWRMSE